MFFFTLKLFGEIVMSEMNNPRWFFSGTSEHCLNVIRLLNANDIKWFSEKEFPNSIFLRYQFDKELASSLLTV
jgi:hypothetical protein